MGRFDELANEFDGEQHQTEKIKKGDIPRIKNVMGAICVDYINYLDWEIRVNEGSITFQKRTDSNQVIKILIDYEKKLAGKIGFILPEENPMVIGLELGSLDSVVRKQIRTWLRKFNNNIDYYVDPVKYSGWQKTTIQPITDHYYDILFLKKGFCEYEENLEIMDRVGSILEQEMEKFHHHESQNEG